MNEMNEAPVVFPREQVMELTGLSPDQLDYWASTGVTRPSSAPHTPGTAVQMYDDQELLALLIIVELQNRLLTLPCIRQIVDHVHSQGYQLSEVSFAVAGARVYFQTPDRGWGNTHRSQHLFHESLDLKPLKARMPRSTQHEWTRIS